MKRALAMALGAIMVTGTAAPASAASQVNFQGLYRAYYLNDTNLGHRGSDKKLTDGYFVNRLQIDLTFNATDEISVYWRLRAPNAQRWGVGPDGNQPIQTHWAYGQIKQDWGTVSVGRLADAFDHLGLATLGWSPDGADGTKGIFTATNPFDGGKALDGVYYVNRWDNGFQLEALYNRIATDIYSSDSVGGYIGPERGYIGSNHDPRYSGSDINSDRYVLQGSYFWDGGGASLAGIYGHFASAGMPNPYTPRTNAWIINPAISHSWGDFSIHFEGQTAWANIRTPDSIGDTGEDKAKGYGTYLDVDYNYGPGNVNLAGWWVAGNSYTDLGTDAESKSLVDMGTDFNPFLVAYNDANGWGRVNASGGGASDNSAIALANNAGVNYVGPALVRNVVALGDFSDNEFGYAGDDAANLKNYRTLGQGSFKNHNGTANHWAIAVTGNHAFTDDISLGYGLGYLALNHPNYSVLDSLVYNEDATFTAAYRDQKKDIGWELDLGLTFQLLDNLTLTTSAGYLFTGGAYDHLNGYSFNVDRAGSVNDRAQANWSSAADAYVWYNTLTFAF
jgi:hypothetical protein